jgi:hypothetical protein
MFFFFLISNHISGQTFPFLEVKNFVPSSLVLRICVFTVSKRQVDMELWKPSAINIDQLLHGQIGPFSLWLKRIRDEVHVAWRRHEPDSLDAQQYKIAQSLGVIERHEEKLDWSRWIIGDKLENVRITPVMPDRPVIVKTEMPIKIPAGQSADFFVSIPLWLKLLAGNPEPIEICELPSVALAGMWFGDPTCGELCYTLRSRARRMIESDQIRPYRAICPVHVKNAAGAQLDFQRVCVRVEHLKIYQGREQLCTNRVDLIYRSQDGTTEISYGQGPPDFEKAPVMLSDARIPFKQNLLKRSFQFCWFL